MKTLGVLGGMSWESTLEYYRLINQAIHEHLGGLHSAKLLLYSVDFDPIAKLMHNHDWNSIGKTLNTCAQELVRAGAQGIILTTNTMHKVYELMMDGLDVPFIHIADPVITTFHREHVQTAGLLGTAYTMEDTFLRSKLEAQGISVLIPDEVQRKEIQRIIFQELVVGTLNPDSRAFFRKTIHDLVKQGAQGIILGCTEIGLLVHPEDCPVFMADTTVLHAQAAAQWMLDDSFGSPSMPTSEHTNPQK